MSQPPGPTYPHPSNQPATSSSLAPATSAPPSSVRAIPLPSNFASLPEVWRKLTQPDPLTGAPSLIDMESAGTSSWRKGQSKRWSEFKLFYEAVQNHAKAMTQARGRIVSDADAVEDLEQKRKAAAPTPKGMTVANAVKKIKILLGSTGS